MNCRSSVWTLAIGICLKSDSILSDMKWNAAVPKCHTTCRWGLSHWGGGERQGTNWGLKVKGHREGRTSWSFHQPIMSSPHPPSPLLLPGLRKANNPAPPPHSASGQLRVFGSPISATEKLRVFTIFSACSENYPLAHFPTWPVGMVQTQK